MAGVSYLIQSCLMQGFVIPYNLILQLVLGNRIKYTHEIQSTILACSIAAAKIFIFQAPALFCWMKVSMYSQKTGTWR